MSTWPVPSTPNPTTEMFPKLSEAHVARLRPLGTVRKVDRGEVLFRPNQSDVHFFVVLSGEMAIVQPDGDQGERVITTHAPYEFTGEINMISGRRSLVLGRITEPGEMLEISPEKLQTVINTDAELSEVLLRAFILRRVALLRAGYGNVIVLGSRHSAATLRLREFLSRNGHPHGYLDLDTDQQAQELLDRFDVKISEIPVVICSGTNVLRNPTVQELADCLGFNLNIDVGRVRDVVIVGGGPSGLAAAVYAASEGLDALILESEAPGGQAGSSSKIENYLGFPTGVSGQELAARAITQAQKFGAKMIVAHRAVQLHCSKRPYTVELENGERIPAKAIIISTGAQYNKPAIANLKDFEGRGVYYGATFLESQLCGDEEVIVVGGGNSAGQAAVFLSQTARKVHILIRKSSLSETMSRYLIQRIEENPRIEMHYRTEIVGLAGEDHLESIEWKDYRTGDVSAHPIRHVFIMAGASPRTDWLRGCVAMDEKGFILTGRDLDPFIAKSSQAWALARHPQMLETSLPGVFAVGDVRSGNVKRVASAVGEGAIAVHLVHRVLAEL